MNQTVAQFSHEPALGWKGMFCLAILFPVLGLYLIPLLLGSVEGTEPAVRLAQVVGAGAALFLGASAFGMMVRGRRAPAEFDGMASLTELRFSDAPPTVHSAPTQFDPADNINPETVWAEEDVPVIPGATAVATREWTLEVLQSLEWRRFEKLCEAYYREKGIRNVAISLAANGGMDIYLFQDEARPKQATAVVHARTRGPVATGVQGVRELLGVMSHEGIERAFFMTNGIFSPEAKALGHHHKIVLVDARVLLAMILRLEPEQQQRLLAEATAGDYTSPTCPMCGQKMTVATGTHGDYWGCSTYPRCTWIAPMVPG